MKEDVLIEVAVALPLTDTYTYRLPEELREAARPGMRVVVPFGKRQVTGYVLGFAKGGIDGVEIKDVIDVLDDGPVFPESLLNDLRWMADYYISPIGETLKGALPAGINVESSPALAITPDGEKALGDSATRPMDREILARIAAEPGIRQKRLGETPRGSVTQASRLPNLAGGTPALRPCKKSGVRSAIMRMARAGWILREETIRKPRVSPRNQTMVRISPSLERPVGAYGHTPLRPSDTIADIISEIEKRAPARARLLAYINSVGEAPLPELSGRFQNASVLVKALVKEGMLTTRRARVWRDPSLGDVPEYEDSPHVLTKDQRVAFEAVTEAIAAHTFAPFLLHGVTGSGKTEVYLRAIAEVLKAGRQALVLVPEIALTPQLLGRFRARFGSEVAVLHSGLGKGERLDEWTRVRDGQVKVAIGARSAIFAPFADIGLIVVDEEHDGGYKQEEKTPYSARDFAMIRARTTNAVIILGSATPSLESYFNATKGRYRLLILPSRVESRPLPNIEVVDLRGKSKGRSEFISNRLEEEMLSNFERRRQTILFLNRRGYAPFLLCLQCGHTFKCPSCSVSLTFHQNRRRLMCHFCDHQEPAPNTCPECHGSNIKMVGIGTERVVEEVKRLIPAARVGRLDRDAVMKKGELNRILGALRDGSLDILVGTQMVAKGHDYPGVTLVGVLMAETSLNFPDFRAAEITFGLLTQVAGRAGRGSDPGKVIVQTYNPEHYAIKRALNHDYEGFVREELKNRQELDYPPYKRLAALRISGPTPTGTRKAAEIAGEAARRCKGVKVAGPAPAPWSKIKNMYRWQLLFKSASPRAVREAARFALQSATDFAKSEKVKISLDVDPLRLL